MKKEDVAFLKDVFTELRVLVVNADREITDRGMAEAVTLNENLKSMGYTLKPAGVAAMAACSEVGSVYRMVKEEFLPDVAAEPMYPDFPSQVLEMDEAEYRFNQCMHYFSTYGLEALFGVEISKGWLPDVESTEKIKEDKALLPCKILDVVDSAGLKGIIITRLVSKRERLTDPETRIVCHLVEKEPQLAGELDFPFKENMMDVLDEVFKSYIPGKDGNYEEILGIMGSMCKHSGDALDFIHHEMVRMNYKTSRNYLIGPHGHFRQSQKRLLTGLVEHYSVDDLRDNLPRDRDRNLTCLRYISYNDFSKDYTHRELIGKFRNREIRSWSSSVEAKIEAYKDKKITGEELVGYISRRPGELLRMAVRLYRIDSSLDHEIFHVLAMKVDSLSLTTLIETAKYFFMPRELREGQEKVRMKTQKVESGQREDEASFMRMATEALISLKLVDKDTPLKGKKGYVDRGIYDFEHSVIDLNTRMADGGYIRSGLAFKIPDDVAVLRFFVYWNDYKRVDVDLHAEAVDTDGDGFHIGWYSDYKGKGMCTSGDITHSDAAEYIDVDVKEAIKNKIAKVKLYLHLYTGRSCFRDIETVFTGMCAVSEAGLDTDVKLYSSKNVFFRHDLNNDSRELDYAEIDLGNRCLRLLGSGVSESEYSLERYLTNLLNAQDAAVVENREDADIILSLDKGEGENCISLIDENYFID